MNLGGTGDHGHWLLHRIRDCSPELVRMLVSAGADVNCSNTAGSTPLHIACSCWGSEETVAIFLAAGAEVNVKDRSLETPLHCAAESQRTGVVKLLLEAGAEVNAVRDDGETPLHCACTEESNEDLVSLLLAAGADVNAKDTHLGRQALHLAAFYGSSPSVVRALLHSGNSSPQDHRGVTPLHLVACWGYLDLARVLVDAGADVHAVDHTQCTALHYAIKWGSSFADNATYSGAPLPTGTSPGIYPPRTPTIKRRGPSTYGGAEANIVGSKGDKFSGAAMVSLLISAENRAQTPTRLLNLDRKVIRIDLLEE